MSAAGGLLAALVLATAVPAAADHYPDVRAGTRRKDRSVLDGISRLINAYSTSITLGPDSCDCLEPTCDDGHMMLACGGEVEPYFGGFVSAARRTSRETCYVCGCAGTLGAELRATPVCVGF